MMSTFYKLVLTPMKNSEATEKSNPIGVGAHTKPDIVPWAAPCFPSRDVSKNPTSTAHCALPANLPICKSSGRPKMVRPPLVATYLDLLDDEEDQIKSRGILPAGRPLYLSPRSASTASFIRFRSLAKGSRTPKYEEPSVSSRVAFACAGFVGPVLLGRTGGRC